MSGGGLETRKEILPKPDVPQGPGVLDHPIPLLIA